MIKMGRCVRLNVVTLVLKIKNSLYTPNGHMSTMSWLEGDEAKQEKAHRVQTIEPGHQEEKKKVTGTKQL